MNAKKGKGKPRPNKPSNPNPPQKEDVEEKVENVVEEIESAQKVEERVPEIISEIVTAPVVDVGGKEEDNPKKPKRNRGKKKNQDKDEGDTQKPPSDDVQLEIIGKVEPQETAVEENVTPSARKKKNKNKKGADSETKKPEVPEKDLSVAVITPDVVETVMKEESKPHEASEQETKASKKKNKKKKQRNDSEKSDVKSEEISCTSAFQNLLKDEKSSNDDVVSAPVNIKTTIPDISKSTEMNISVFIQELEKVEDVDYSSPEAKSAGKNKKKNKKEKKEPPKEKESEIITEISLMTAIKPITKDESTQKEDKMLKEEQPTELKNPTDVTKMIEDTKPKAKIAKPVERKRKGKEDKHAEEPIEIMSFEKESEIKREPLKEKVRSALDMPIKTDIIGETEEEEFMIFEPITGEDTENVPKPTEKTKKGKANKQGNETMTGKTEEEEFMIFEPITGADIENVPKPAEKKKKGKANKQGNETMTDVTKCKDDMGQKEPKTIPTLEKNVTADVSKQAEIIEGSFKEDPFVLPESIQEVKATIPEDVKGTENKQEKTESKAEKKRKGKKDNKIEDPFVESDKVEKESSTTKSAISEKKVEDFLGFSDILTAEDIKNIEDVIPGMPKETEYKQSVSEPKKGKQKAKKETPKSELIQSISQVQQVETKEENIQLPTTDIFVQSFNIAPQSELFKDIPFIPDPIENIQTKQEIEGNINIETAPKAEAVDFKETSFINPTESIGKKRKKSPKPPKRDQKTKETESMAEVISETLIASTEEVILLPAEQKPIVEDITFAPSTILPEQEIKFDKTKATNMPEPIPTTVTEILPEPDDLIPFDTKNKKKRKKSPKLPQVQDTVIEATTTAAKEKVTEQVEDKTIPVSEDVANKTVKTEKLKIVPQESEDIFYDLPSDLEISSLKAEESEGSACAFTPDIIQYPRATSQDLLDDNNNNMLIQEITSAEEVKLQIPFQIPDTPLIQGSGTTPIETPDNILAGIKISRVDVDKCETEKTDIKSKMMEVNQDMEELRLSIERSLAELTSIEKSEGDVEKQFEDRQKLTEEVMSADIKISMPSDIVAKAQTETKEPQTLKTQCKKAESKEKSPCEVAKTKENTNSGAPTLTFSENKPVEAHIPPKISMFFDKELKDTGEQLKPDIIQQEISPVVDFPKVIEKIVDAPLSPVLTPVTEMSKVTAIVADIIPPVPPMRKEKSASKERDNKDAKMKPIAEIKPVETITTSETAKPAEIISDIVAPPVCPARKDNKNKGKNKKKGKQEAAQSVGQAESASIGAETKETKKEEKGGQKSQPAQEKGKQQSDAVDQKENSPVKQQESSSAKPEFAPIENFEDAMTSSADDINKTFEIIANEASRSIEASNVNPEIKIVAPVEDTHKKEEKSKRDEKINPVSQPKNFLGQPDIPVRLNKTDYKKEKNKTPNAVLAKVKIKDSIEIEGKKQSRDTQTDNIKKFMKNKSIDESFSSISNENEEFVYKYSFRKVFLPSACHVCKKDLKQMRVPCNFCNLVFYCSAKHKDEDWSHHQELCFAISTIVHLKDQKHIYADAQNVTGQDWRLLRMQMIVSCERALRRRLAPWQQEALLYPRVCATSTCREWRANKLVDCDGCGQISYCANNPSHFPKSHQRWCKSYALYQKLVFHQQTKGRLEPKLPSKVMVEPNRIPDKINEALATMYEEKIDMNDIQYAALTQIATAPLTAAYCHQTYASTSQANGTYKKPSCTVHIVGGELQFEADALNKWEVFFLHLRPQLQELRVVMVGADLNPSGLPLDLLAKVKLCETCRFNKRRVVFSFQDKSSYHDYRSSDDFISPDIVCAFNPSIKRCAMYNGKDPWPKTIDCVLKQKVPFLVTSHTMNELQRDLARVKECSEVDVRVM